MWAAILFTFFTIAILFMLIGFYAYDISKINNKKMWRYVAPYIILSIAVSLVPLGIVWSTV
jgi:hypothetical protein